MKKLLFILFFLPFIACIDKETKIEWVDNLKGDFSFAQNSDYPENVFRNDYGELVCDGMCDPLLDEMRDENGRIIPDSIFRYYQLLDTTHLYHTLQSEASTYEWAGADFAEAYRNKDKTINCYTLRNAATHSSLVLKIDGNYCSSYIELLGVANTEPAFFTYKEGWIKIDKNLFEKGILKAEFDLQFKNPDNPDKPMWWKGKIYTEIKTR